MILYYVPCSESYAYNIYIHHPDIKLLIREKYNASIAYDCVFMDDDDDISGLFADLITNYGFDKVSN